MRCVSWCGGLGLRVSGGVMSGGVVDTNRFTA